MKFSVYDTLSQLILGFFVISVGIYLSNEYSWEKDHVVLYTVISFITGYLINALASWLEPVYFFTWGGKPSSAILNGKSTWQIKFYDWEEAKKKLKQESKNPEPSNDELFQIAIRTTIEKDSRIEDFNASYAFSRGIFTATIIVFIVLIFLRPKNLLTYITILPLIAFWYRAKERGYYYAREVLNTFLNPSSGEIK